MKNLEKILNQVEEVNPVYADKLDLIIERALTDSAYANTINFYPKADSLIELFIFTMESEANGLDWAGIYSTIQGKELDELEELYED